MPSDMRHLCRSWCTQFRWLLQRSFVAQLRNPTDVTGRLLLSVWIGLFAGAPMSLHAGPILSCSPVQMTCWQPRLCQRLNLHPHHNSRWQNSCDAKPLQLKSAACNSGWVLPAGLVFFNIPDGPALAFQRACVMFFTMLLFELLPFCYVSFYSWDRKFFLADRVSGTYATSAYFTAHMLAGKLLGHVPGCSPCLY